jgi:hypothetical protein
MAVCDYCSQEMCEAPTCDRRFRKQVRFGDESHGGCATEDGRCHDCGCEVGGFHHAGCDAEECPQCHGQRLTCDLDKHHQVGGASVK